MGSLRIRWTAGRGERLPEEEWCRREQLEYSSPALLARLIICQDVRTTSANMDVFQVLVRLSKKRRSARPPHPWDPAERWREFVEWRHPRIDLNLLQLAVIFDRKDCVEYLWRPVFTREENYRGKFDRYSPLHGHIRFKCCWISCTERNYGFKFHLVNTVIVATPSTIALVLAFGSPISHSLLPLHCATCPPRRYASCPCPLHPYHRYSCVARRRYHL